MDLDAVWSSEWVGRGMGVLDRDPRTSSKGKEVGYFLLIGLNGVLSVF